ncbi:hypothetical protein [Gaetbulibacter aestuarii]|uniref:Uncharacterized protein n=1 Tax=Gaetbulibacter aestuarii TaxID=1502358 RepID=A0ABW7MWT4_9FLAO
MFKQRKPRRFNYQPKFSQENQARTADGEAEDDNKAFLRQWREERRARRKSRPMFSMRTLLIVLVLLLICIYMLQHKYIQ